MPIGLFIAAWTSYRNIVFIAPLIGFTVFGVGFYMIITAILNYVRTLVFQLEIVDMYVG